MNDWCGTRAAVLAVATVLGIGSVGLAGQLPEGLASQAAEFLVVAGHAAPDAERRAAGEIAAAFRACGGPADNLVDDYAALADINRAACRHLVLVGTYTSNEVLHEQWGHRAIDRPAWAAEPAVPTDAPRPPFYAGMPGSGFFVHGFGTFVKSTGCIESGRNDLCLVPAALDTPQKPPYRIRINITGSDSAGVARAARVFLQTGLVGGVIPADDEQIPAKGDALLLARERYAYELPAFIPRKAMLGWMLPDATEYAGFLQASGQAARRIWRVKYVAGGGISGFDAGPDRRATANELFVAEMASAEAAAQAADGLARSLSGKPQELKFEPVTLGAAGARRSGDFHLAAAGSYVLMETLPEPLGAATMTDALGKVGK